MAAKQAEWLKDLGNRRSEKEDFKSAIDFYTKAITLSPRVPVYWINRAICYMKQKDWSRAEEDCRKAIQLDHNSAKAHCVLGLALLERKELADGMKELQTASSRADPTGFVIDEIRAEIAKAKYMEWELVSAKRSGEMNSLKETCKAALEQQHTLGMSQTEDVSHEAYSSHTEQLKALDGVFEKAATDDKPTEVPDYLCCNLTRGILQRPVISPCGITYEKEAILEHLDKAGNIDPISGKELDQSKLVPNLAIKKAVAAYIEKHAWAYKGYADGMKELQRALNPGRCTDPAGCMVEEVSREVAKAKYTEWELVSAKRLQELKSLKETCKAALEQQHTLGMSQTEDVSQEAYYSHTEQLKALDGVFEKAATDDKPTDVPEYMCCNITLAIFRDPVITPTGVTYERDSIIEQINKVGCDPISRAELDLSMLVPNLALKKAVAAYLEKHAWAYKDW